MKRYFKIVDDEWNIIAFGIGLDGIEITEEEYELLKEKSEEKMEYFRKFLNKEISEDDIHEEYKNEIVLLYNNIKINN